MHDTHQDISGHQIEQKKNCARLRIFALGLRIFCARFADWVLQNLSIFRMTAMILTPNGYMRDPDAMWSVHDMHA